MRMALSISFTFIGVAAIYLFAAGAFAEQAGDRSVWDVVVESALRPFGAGGLGQSLAMTLGMASLVFGILVAPRSDVWVALHKGGQGTTIDSALESRLVCYTQSIAKGKVLEIVLAFNALLVLGILVLLGMSAFQPGSERLVGALYIAGLLEALVGLAVLVSLFLHRRGTRQRGVRPILAASAGLNILEVLFLVGVLVCGWVN